MERVKKRKLKFPCLIGGNDETASPRSVQSRSPAGPSIEQSLLKFEVGKSTSKQRNGNRMKRLFTKGISNGISSKKRSPSILVKLMRRGRLSYKTVVLKQKTTVVKNGDHSSDQCTKSTQHFGSLTKCKCIDDTETVPEISTQMKKGFESGQVGLYRYDYYVDESLNVLRSGSVSESEEITVPFRIIFDQHDRLTHSLTCMSASSLITEATNRMIERLNTTHINEDVLTVSKSGEIPSFHFPEKETNPADLDIVMGLVGINEMSPSPTELSTVLGNCSQDGQGDGSTSLQSSFNILNYERNVSHVDDIDDKVYNEPTNQGRKVKNYIFNYEEDVLSQHVRLKKRSQPFQKSSGTSCDNEDPFEYQSSVSDTDVDAQSSGPESEDVTFQSDCFERVNSRLQDVKKNLHLLKVGSKLTSNKLTLMPKVKHNGQLSSVSLPESVSWESAYMAHILQTLEIDAIALDTSSASFRSDAMHHPIDQRLCYCLEKYYFDETALSRNEKRLFYDYVEEMFTRNSKSTVAYPWVNPVKRESQLRLPKSSLEDQIRNVVVEIGKDEDEDFSEIYIDKDSEWVQQTNEIDILGKLVADLVLNGLLLEVVDL